MGYSHPGQRQFLSNSKSGFVLFMLSSSHNEVFINKRQLAKRLDVSLPTISLWIEKYPDFPIEVRGTNGSSYKFNAEHVFAFLQKKKEEEQEKNAEKDQKLASLQLTFDNLLGDSDEGQNHRRFFSTKEEKDIWQLRELKRKEAERCGKLVIADEIRDHFINAFTRLGTESRNFISRLCRNQNMPEQIIKKTENDFAEMQRIVVSQIAEVLDQEGDIYERTLDLNQPG